MHDYRQTMAIIWVCWCITILLLPQRKKKKMMDMVENCALQLATSDHTKLQKLKVRG
jgi:hypothetical protein